MADRGRPKKKPAGTVTLDIANAHQIPGAIDETRISLEDVFKHGTWEEAKDLWALIAVKIQDGVPLHEVEARHLSQALLEMYATGSADKAFGVKRKGLSPQYVKSMMYLVDSLERQGMLRAEAWDKLARLDLKRGGFRNYTKAGANPGDSLRKQIQPAYKRMFGGNSGKKNS